MLPNLQRNNVPRCLSVFMFDDAAFEKAVQQLKHFLLGKQICFNQIAHASWCLQQAKNNTFVFGQLQLVFERFRQTGSNAKNVARILGAPSIVLFLIYFSSCFEIGSEFDHVGIG